jgi:hypothetical protein
LHFCRYATLVASLGAEVILSVPAPLKTLLTGLKGVSRVLAFNDELPEFDTYCKLMSLPYVLGTSLATVPSDVPYLHAQSTSVERWRNELGPHTRPRVGLAWSGNPRYPNDHIRSMNLAQLLAHLPRGPQYFILQKTIRDSDRDALGLREDLIDMSGSLEDFSITAGLCECMDLVLSVDTSVAHLAGALGRRTWILLPRYADWRWMLDRTDSPWYPTATLFRAPQKGDWSEPLGRVHQALVGLSSHG